MLRRSTYENSAGGSIRTVWDETILTRRRNRIRWGRNRTRFMPVPPEYDNNSGNHFLLHAALAAGLYPKILAVDPVDRKSVKTVLNSQACQFHPSSVNSKGSLDFRGNHMVYFTLMCVCSLRIYRRTKLLLGILRSFMLGKPVRWMTLL